jgi:hypothetical protein
MKYIFSFHAATTADTSISSSPTTKTETQKKKKEAAPDG